MHELAACALNWGAGPMSVAYPAPLKIAMSRLRFSTGDVKFLNLKSNWFIAYSTRNTNPSAYLIWSLEKIGGMRPALLGHSRVIDSTVGSAIEFNGKEDAIYLDTHPLAGAETFTWEVLFRPDSDGSPEQRCFHLSEKDMRTGQDTQIDDHILRASGHRLRKDIAQKRRGFFHEELSVRIENDDAFFFPPADC